MHSDEDKFDCSQIEKLTLSIVRIQMTSEESGKQLNEKLRNKVASLKNQLYLTCKNTFIPEWQRHLKDSGNYSAALHANFLKAEPQTLHPLEETVLKWWKHESLLLNSAHAGSSKHPIGLDDIDMVKTLELRVYRECISTYAPNSPI